mmetsp:Transcript_7343/g.12086  ORF Transcript_7343/g.12086 Transcript_7343/m.12086 type:complete len:93 (-) Transcript_7343:38-316(-)
MSINNKNETTEQHQQGRRDDIGKTMEYIAQRCQRCISCDRLIDITGTQVIKITCPMCKSTWCMLCRQRWNVHGAHSGGLQSCNFVNSKLVVG